MLKRFCTAAGVTPRLSASLVILRARGSSTAPPSSSTFDVLLVQRSRKMKFAGAAWVFPGGVYDAADGPCEDPENKLKSLRRCALRETFEEVGMCDVDNLTPPTSLEKWRAWRETVHEDAAKWDDMLKDYGVDGLASGGDAADVVPATCFFTPEFEAARSGSEFGRESCVRACVRACRRAYGERGERGERQRGEERRVPCPSRRETGEESGGADERLSP